MSYISKKNKLIFLLPPKTGSTSLQSCLVSSNILCDSIIEKPNHPTIHLLLSETLKAYNIKIDELNQYKIIQVTRNPYDRFVSAVYHQNIITKKNYTVSEYLEELNKYLNLLPNNEDLYYEKFYGTILHKENNFKNNHWGGLRFWFKQEWWNDIGADVNYFKLESITKNLEELSEFINIKLVNFPYIRPGDSNRNNKYEKYFDETTQINFEKLYNSDIEKFNYEFYNPLSKNLI
jgi:hypothetical protein